MPFLSEIQIRTTASAAALSLMLSLLSVLLPVTATPAHAAYNDSSCDLVSLSTLGSGQAGDPYVLTNADQLWEVTDCTTNDAQVLYFELGNDIDVSNASAGVPTTSPIGSRACDSNSKRFRGVLDGKGYSISGLAISTTSCGVGLFGALRYAEIKNLSLYGALTSSATLVGSPIQPHWHSGAIAQYSENQVTISNVSNYVSLASQQYLGGFVGYSGGNLLISSSINAGTVHSTTTSADANRVGGFVGYAAQFKRLSITLSENFAEVGDSANAKYAGGFVGYSYGDLEISYSTNSGTVSGKLDIGGLAGLAGGGLVSLSHVANYGDVKGGSSVVGGLFGFLASNEISILNSLNAGDVQTGGSQVGGLIGEFGGTTTTTISNFVNRGIISTTNMNAMDGGGLIGWMKDNGTFQTITLTDIHNLGDVSMGRRAGGIVGALEIRGRINFENVRNSATISSLTTNTSYKSNAGGILGEINPPSAVDLTLIEVANFGQIAAKVTYVGGLIGSSANSYASISISQSLNSGMVSGSGTVGGFIGRSMGPLTIQDSYNAGEILTTGMSGGLSAEVRTGPVSASNLYSSATSTNDSLFSASAITPNVTDAYVLTYSAYASESSVLDFQSVSTFTDWDFTNIWGMPSCSVNNGYPVLRWAYPNETFYDLSCGVNSAPAVAPSTPSTPSTPAVSAPQPYRGPLITSAQKIVYRGENVILDGLRLDSVSEAYVLSVQLDILSATSTSITLAISTSTALGVQDLVFISSYGRLTTMAALDVREAPPAAVNPSELLGFTWTLKFTGNSRDLSSTQIEAVNTSTGKFPAASTVICWGYTTASEPNAWAMEHANARASSVCDLIAESNPTLKTAVRIRTGMPKSAAMRVAIQFWKSSTTD